jgi:hypothetical protein
VPVPAAHLPVWLREERLIALTPDIGGEALPNKSHATRWPCHYLIKIILDRIDTSKCFSWLHHRFIAPEGNL